MASVVPNNWKGLLYISVSELCFKNVLYLLVTIDQIFGKSKLSFEKTQQLFESSELSFENVW